MSIAAVVDPHPGHLAGTDEFSRLQTAMLGAALAAFALLYTCQPLLPALSREYGVTAATASLTVSTSTGCLALAILPLSSLAEALGRVRMMRMGLFVACALVLVSPFVPFWLLLLLRAGVGVALAAVIAVAMGHVGDEVHPTSLGAAMGIYVAGNTLGGVGGRLISAVAGGDHWRLGVVTVGGVALASAAVFSRFVPEPVRFRPVPLSVMSLTDGLRTHVRDRGILRLCIVAFLMMGGFVSVYNYLTFRLVSPEFGLTQRVAGMLFLAYLAGTASSTIAGRCVDRYGQRPTLLTSSGVMSVGLLTTLAGSLVIVGAGLFVFTAGFFGIHAAASGWVSARARGARAQASALYLTAYYGGSSVLGTATGIAYQHGSWPAVVAAVSCYLLVAVGVVMGVRPLTID